MTKHYNNFKSLRDEMTFRKYSRRTIDTYVYYNKKFLDSVQKSPRQVSTSDIKLFLTSVANTSSASTVALVLNALKFYYKIIYKRYICDTIAAPRKEKKLPSVLSRQEIITMINKTNNKKHKTILQLLYGTGMRLSEIRKLRIHDIDFDRGIIHVRQAKGAKDRIVHLPTSCRNVLLFQKGIKEKDAYIFTGRGSQMLNARTIQAIVRKAAERAQIKKRVSPHTMRHSFATHLLESGTDIRFIQHFLGHNKIQTTERYTHVANTSITKIKSPLDTL